MSVHIPLEEVGALRTRTQALAAEHDRLYRELERLGRTVDHQTTALRDAQRKLHAAATVRCWTNEDGKRFVFADDLAEALGYGPSASARTAEPDTEETP